MRPSLTVMVEGNETRLLADLADKPWAAEDGEPWRASFPIALEINGIEKAELTVAPDITIALRSTPDAPGGRKRKPAGGRSDSARTRSRGDAGERQRRELTRAIDRVEAEKAQIAGRLDDLLGQLSQVARERDEVARERDQLIAERDELSGERDRLMTERDSVQQERDEISAELAAARSARGEALTANKSARLAYDRARADRDAATAAHRSRSRFGNRGPRPGDRRA